MNLDPANILEVHHKITPYIRRTPLIQFSQNDCRKNFGLDLQSLAIKLENFQVSGSYKARGAFNLALSKSEEEKRRGFTAVSAGNHAIAVAHVASALSVPAKVVMIKTANPARISRARAYGAEVILAEDGPSAFAMVEEIKMNHGLCFLHPFDTPETILGVSTIVHELRDQVQNSPDFVLVPTGGGGLLSGISFGTKSLFKGTRVIGVNPRLSSAMHDSLKSKSKVDNKAVTKIADSLCPPMIGNHCFAVCQKNVDDMLLIDDEFIRLAMKTYLDEFRLMIEGAGSSSLAALYQHQDRFKNKNLLLILSGSNIDTESFQALIA